jgi:hypothetical protein
MTELVKGSMELSDDSAAVHAANLLRHYSFELGYTTIDELLAVWCGRYPTNWVRLAVIEALYQGRYKAISVEQILEFWQRRGQPVYHFNHEFERLVCHNFPRDLVPRSEPKPELEVRSPDPLLSYRQLVIQQESPAAPIASNSAELLFLKEILTHPASVLVAERADSHLPASPQLQPVPTLSDSAISDSSAKLEQQNPAIAPEVAEPPCDREQLLPEQPLLECREPLDLSFLIGRSVPPHFPLLLCSCNPKLSLELILRYPPQWLIELATPPDSSQPLIPESES